MRRIIVASFVLLACIELPPLPHDTRPGEHPLGKLLWKFNVGYRAYLTIADGVIYAASPTGCSDFVPCGPPARLFALDDRTGRQKWMIENISEDSAPVVSDGLVYQAGGSLYAVNAQTGQVEWKVKPTTNGSVMYSPAIAGGMIFFWEVQALIPAGFFGGTLYAVDLKTRQQKWKFSVDRGMVSSPVADNGLIYVGTTSDPGLSKGSLYALDARTGRVRWRFRVAGPTPVSSRGAVYYAGADGILYALDARSGRKVWQFKAARGLSSPAVADRLVYFAPYGQHLAAIDSNTGQQKWEFKTGLVVYLSPTVASGVVYVGSFVGELYALEAETGRELWKFTMGNSVVSSPVVDNDIVYVASQDGYIYAIK